MKWRALTVAFALLAAGCSGADDTTAPPIDEPDPPGDGDGDADFLTDAQEQELGTDPTNPDTDGDSYLDGDEVLENTDPTDATSVIYTGGWPYQRNKDDIVDPGFDGAPEVGGTIPRLVSVDQHGEMLDIYDYAMHGKPVVIDLSAGWCAACQEVSLWLEGEGSLGDGEFDAIPDMVKNGDILWVTVVFENGSSTPATENDVANWYAQYPNPDVAIMADDDRALFDWLWPGGYPAIFVLDENMALQSYDRFNYIPALQTLIE
jgi:thiol-disulfide isomerase/thioredoxin